MPTDSDGTRVFRYVSVDYTQPIAVEWNENDDFSLFPPDIATYLISRGYAIKAPKEIVDGYNSSLDEVMKKNDDVPDELSYDSEFSEFTEDKSSEDNVSVNRPKRGRPRKE